MVLKHGLESGNLALFCNGKLLLVEYDVFDDRSVSFFIDEELCRIEIQKVKGQFQYRFVIDEKVDTPLNRVREEARKTDRRKSLLLIGSLAVFFLALILGQYFYNQSRILADIRENGRVTVVQVHYVQVNGHWEGRFTYPFRGAIYDGSVEASEVDQAGEHQPEEFLLRYSKRRPERHHLLLNQPSLTQLRRDRQGLLENCIQQLGSSRKPCDCLLQESYQQEGPTAWKSLKAQQLEPETWQSSRRRLGRTCDLAE